MKVLIADDHPLVRDALARTLRGIDPALECIEADDHAGALAALAQHAGTLALVLADLHMPGMDAAEGLRQLMAAAAGAPVVVVSGDNDPAVMRATFAAGAMGFLPKSEAPGLLQQALRIVLGGGSYMPSQALADLRQGAATPPPDASGLTPRQRDVLRSLMRGLPNKLIARELGLTEGTVKIHIAAILRALQARNRTEAVVVARRLGLEA
jgi:DNA-binding NarL/FixJ family response regulator